MVQRANRARRVLVISHDVVGATMAGPGIRYYHLSRVLAEEFQVTLAVPNDVSNRNDGTFRRIQFGAGDDTVLERELQAADVIVVPAILLAQIPALHGTSIPVVVDGYNPYLAETLSIGAADAHALQVSLTQAYLRGDFFLCASERQRDWWLGLLEAHGRINRWTFDADPALRQLVDVVPFGLPTTPARHTQQVIKGVWDGIAARDRLILWGGGLWPWLDPFTAIRALAVVRQHRQDVRLVFPGTRHPNPDMQAMHTHVESARDLARRLGLLGTGVLFGDWVPYRDWPSVLCESDVALSLHHDTLETRLAFRSRVLEYLWAGVPTVCTRGDATSRLVAEHDLGIVVDYEREQEVAQGVLRLLETDRDVWDARSARVRRRLSWEQAAEPLIQFCRDPRRAPDREAGEGELGNPFYIGQTGRLRSERDRLEALVRGYEQGRFMRLMRWLDEKRRDVGRRFS